MYVPRAMYSFSISFWMVPPIFARSAPCFLATQRKASRTAAVALIVMEVVTWSSGIPLKQDLHIRQGCRWRLRLSRPHRWQGVVGVVANLRRKVEGHREAGLALVEQVAVATVRLLGVTETGVLSHRPEPAAIHRRLDAAGERKFARVSELRRVAPIGKFIGRVECVDQRSGARLKSCAPIRETLQRAQERAIAAIPVSSVTTDIVQSPSGEIQSPAIVVGAGEALARMSRTSPALSVSWRRSVCAISSRVSR